MNNDESTQPWLAVIGRSLAFLCLIGADLRDKDLATQATFLEGLGLSRKDVAVLLGSSEGSISVVLSRRKLRKGKSGQKKASQ
jgi:hypothetical protein